MPEFIAKKKRVIKPLLVKFWQRYYGPLWFPFEREQIKRFSAVRVNEPVDISGYVKCIRKGIFALFPTPFSNQTYLTCINHTEKDPPENAFIRISGVVKWEKLTRNRNLPAESRIFSGEKVVHVEYWKEEIPNIEFPKLNYDYKDFKRDLLYRIEGLEPKIEDFIAFSALSSPPLHESIGGVSLTLYDSTKTGLPKLVIREIKRVIPSDLGNPFVIRTSYGPIRLQYKFNYRTEDADKPLSNLARTLLMHREKQLIPNYDELSLSLFSKRSRPLTIEEPPCCRSDIPTVVPETTYINSSKPAYVEFDALKYLLWQHMKTPIVVDYEKSIPFIQECLEKTVEKYRLPSTQLGAYGFLDANYNARPTSIIRKSLAYARAQNLKKVNQEVIQKVFNEYFKWNLDWVYEVWEDLLSPERGISTLVKVEYREIMRVLRNYDNEGGIPVEIIAKELNESPYKVQEKLTEMWNSGLVFEVKRGSYRLIRI